jgi:hypothetical protein
MRGKILAEVPKSLIPLIRNLVRPILGDLEEAVARADIPAITSRILEFHFTMTSALTYSRGGKGQRRNRQITRNITILAASRSTEPTADLPHQPIRVEPSADPREPPASPTGVQSIVIVPISTPPLLQPSLDQATPQQIKRSDALAKANHLGRAARSLYQSGLADMDGQNVNKLRALHPTGPLTRPSLYHLSLLVPRSVQ